MKYLHSLLQYFWNSHKQEYLKELREYYTIAKENKNVIRLEDIVLVYNHNAKRKEWKLGKVV